MELAKARDVEERRLEEVSRVAVAKALRRQERQRSQQMADQQAELERLRAELIAASTMALLAAAPANEQLTAMSQEMLLAWEAAMPVERARRQLLRKQAGERAREEAVERAKAEARAEAREEMRREMAVTQGCPICLNHAKDCAFQCGHLTCFGCAQQLSICPVCRAPIDTRMRIY